MGLFSRSITSYFDKKSGVQQPKASTKKRMNLDDMADDAEEEEKSSDEGSNAGSQDAASDYDVEEEYDNDYAEDHFNNGEGEDDMDDVGGGAGDEGGGSMSWLIFIVDSNVNAGLRHRRLRLISRLLTHHPAIVQHHSFCTDGLCPLVLNLYMYR